jgi:hypothetical protein
MVVFWLGYAKVSRVYKNHQVVELGLAVVCPIINTDRKNPFHVPVDSDKLTGFVMSVGWVIQRSLVFIKIIR